MKHLKPFNIITLVITITFCLIMGARSQQQQPTLAKYNLAMQKVGTLTIEIETYQRTLGAIAEDLQSVKGECDDLDIIMKRYGLGSRTYLETKGGEKE